MVTTTDTSTAPATATAARVARAARAATVTGPLLVATDGSSSAEPGFIAAHLLAERLHSEVDVVSVFESGPLFLPPPQILPMPTDFDNAGIERLRARARQQVRNQVGDDAPWHVDVLPGQPASTIRDIARDRKASLVITGISRHGIVDRVFGEETAAHIAAITDTPILAVTSPFTRLPRTVIVAIDMDSPLIPDAPAIRELLSEATAVYFVNAKPRLVASEAYDLSAWDRLYADAVAEAYDRIKASLDLPAKATQQLVELTGSPASEILDFARFGKADLIIVGQRRQSLLRRRFGTGLPTRLLRSTTCPVLVLPRTRERTVPGWLSARAPAGDRQTVTMTDRRQWSSRLALLSRRNIGRSSTLEVDDVELGAQAQAIGYPFAGADYDHIDDRVEIMFGARGAGAAHLTHSVERPTSIDILEGPNGEMLALRVANDRGQALVSFTA